MLLPPLTADVSLYKSSGHYRSSSPQEVPAALWQASSGCLGLLSEIMPDRRLYLHRFPILQIELHLHR